MIKECKKMSKRKYFRVVEVLSHGLAQRAALTNAENSLDRIGNVVPDQLLVVVPEHRETT